MAAISTLSDNFLAGSLNGTLWSSFTAGGATLSYSGLGAQCNYPASSTSATDGDVSSQSFYSLTSSQAFVKVTAIPSAATGADATFTLRDSGATNILSMQVESGTLFAEYVISGSQTNAASVAYNSTTHAFWQIRESGGTTFWETSPDGSSWSTLLSHLNVITVTSLQVAIGGSCYQNETNPGTFRWSNFNTLSTGTTPTNLFFF